MHHVESPEHKDSLKVQQDPKQRRNSLAELIPGWPVLTHKKRAGKVLNLLGFYLVLSFRINLFFRH